MRDKSRIKPASASLAVEAEATMARMGLAMR
jgi:hypothetical protein